MAELWFQKIIPNIKEAVEMKNRLLGLTLLLVVLSGYCFAAPRLSYPDPGILVPGETKYDQVISRFGTPKSSEVSTNDQGTFTNIAYSESGSLRKGVLPMRRLALYFKDNVLIGFDWESNFKEDSTDFDETKASQIKKGETTWQQAAAIIGTKYGVYTYPRTDSPDERVLVFMFIQVRTEMTGFMKAVAHNYTKLLALTYGSDDIVKNISLSVSGEK
jgi:hypothetical protein